MMSEFDCRHLEHLLDKLADHLKVQKVMVLNGHLHDGYCIGGYVDDGLVQNLAGSTIENALKMANESKCEP